MAELLRGHVMATTTTRAQRLPNWVSSIAPLVAIALLAIVFVILDPIGQLREVPPVEAIAVERTTLEEGSIELQVRNDGPDPVTISQVLVNDDYWDHTIGDRELGRLESTEVTIPYPWDEGLPLNIALVTSTGLTIEHDIEVAALTPEPDAGTFTIYALLGIYIGVIPIAIGLLWFPALKRASRRWLGFFLAFTIGLLAFLLIDTVAEGFDIAGQVPGVFDGVALLAMGAIGAVLVLNSFEAALGARRETGAIRGLALAYLISAGIGLHNLGEGLAVGAALAAGEIALGTFLVLGFALHNTTEGLAIVAPLGSEEDRPRLTHFIALGALAGAPTILGAWAGGFVYSPTWAALAFGVAAGAIAQVIWTISRTLPAESRLGSGYGAWGFAAGLTVMYVTGLAAL
jgi:ZIP family zinc transporter